MDAAAAAVVPAVIWNIFGKAAHAFSAISEGIQITYGMAADVPDARKHGMKNINGRAANVKGAESSVMKGIALSAEPKSMMIMRMLNWKYSNVQSAERNMSGTERN